MNPPDPTHRSTRSVSELADALREAARRLSATTQTSDDARSLAERTVGAFIDAISTGNLDELGGLVSHDVTYRIPGRSRISGLYEGPQGIEAACAILPTAGATDLASELDAMFVNAGGDRAVSFHSITGRCNGAEIEIAIALDYRLQDGLIVAIAEYSGDQYGSDALFE